jgi:hypothetical protein
MSLLTAEEAVIRSQTADTSPVPTDCFMIDEVLPLIEKIAELKSAINAVYKVIMARGLHTPYCNTRPQEILRKYAPCGFIEDEIEYSKPGKCNCGLIELDIQVNKAME